MAQAFFAPAPFVVSSPATGDSVYAKRFGGALFAIYFDTLQTDAGAATVPSYQFIDGNQVMYLVTNITLPLLPVEPNGDGWAIQYERIVMDQDIYEFSQAESAPFQNRWEAINLVTLWDGLLTGRDLPLAGAAPTVLGNMDVLDALIQAEVNQLALRISPLGAAPTPFLAPPLSSLQNIPYLAEGSAANGSSGFSGVGMPNIVCQNYFGYRGWCAMTTFGAVNGMQQDSAYMGARHYEKDLREWNSRYTQANTKRIKAGGHYVSFSNTLAIGQLIGRTAERSGVAPAPGAVGPPVLQPELGSAVPVRNFQVSGVIYARYVPISQKMLMAAALRQFVNWGQQGQQVGLNPRTQ